MKEFGKAWIKALRSGEYRQAQGALCEKGNEYDEFCCLGVAANLLIEAGHPLEWRDKGRKQYVLVQDGKEHGSDATLHNEAPKWMKRFLIKHEYDLINKNDDGWSFKRIANYIERNL